MINKRTIFVVRRDLPKAINFPPESEREELFLPQVPEIKKIIEQKPNPLPAVKRKRFSWEQGQEQVPARSPHEDAHVVCEGSAFNFFWLSYILFLRAGKKKLFAKSARVEKNI